MGRKKNLVRDDVAVVHLFDYRNRDSSFRTTSPRSQRQSRLRWKHQVSRFMVCFPVEIINILGRFTDDVFLNELIYRTAVYLQNLPIWYNCCGTKKISLYAYSTAATGKALLYFYRTFYFSQHHGTNTAVCLVPFSRHFFLY